VDLHRLQTPFVIVDGVATALYMPLRMTRDVDILVLARDAPALYEELERVGSARLGDLAIGGTSWQLPDGSRLDVVVSAARGRTRPCTVPTGRPRGGR